MTQVQKRVALSASLILFALVMFRVVWPGGVVIHSQDYNYGLMAMYKAELPSAMFDGFWRGFPLLGRAGTTPPTLTNLLLLVLPIEVYMDWIYPILLLISTGFLTGFLRLRGLERMPAIAGGLTAFWLGSNLTLIHPGHLLKYGVLACAAAALFCLEKTHQTRSWRWAALTGGSLGWMMMHQADLALFFGLILGAYHLFRSSEDLKSRLPTLGINTVVLLAIAGLLVWESYQTQMETQVRNVDILQQGTEEEKWDFATQWSFPPTEGLDLIAPGYWGWTTPHETVPYHGVTGQSAEWKAVKQGFPNFRMESVYLGLLPLGLALLALFGEGTSRKHVLFWAIAAGLTLLLSFGKFTPLYRLFFELPLVNAIRNPNKFLQVFQVCLGILTAYGFQALLNAPASSRLRRSGTIGFLLASILLGIGSLLTHPHAAAQLEAFAGTVWESRAVTLLENRQVALLHASLLGAGATLCLVGMKSARFRNLAIAGVVLLIGFDGLWLGRHYLKPAPVSFLQTNPLADFLEEHLGEHRVSFLQPDGISNYYMTQLFPAHHIAFADIAVAPRLGQDYQRYFEAVGTGRMRIWQEFGVKYVLAPRSQAEGLFRQSPHLKRILSEAWSYTLTQSAPGNLEIIPGTRTQPGNLLVLEFNLPSDRFTLLNSALPATEDEVITSIDSGQPPLRQALVQDPDFVPFHNTEPAGEITGVLQDHQGFLIQLQVDTPRAFLRLADHVDPSLRARINGGDPIPLQQTDLLFAGLELPAGIHEIEFFADLPRAGQTAQWIGLIACLGIAISFGVRRNSDITSAES